MFKTNEKMDLAPHKNILFKSRFDLQNKVNSKKYFNFIRFTRTKN